MTHATIKLERGSVDFTSLPVERISLWHFAPRWPNHPKARLTAQELAAQLKRAYMAAVPSAHMVLWMPASYLHYTSFDPLAMAKPWNCFSTLISGADKPTIGYIYSTNPGARGWGSEVLFDARGRGPSSSGSMKLILDRLDTTGGSILDPYAHKSATLAMWSRRWNIPYWGYIHGKKNYESARKVLEQVELPGIQTSLLEKEEGKRNG